MCLLLSVIQPLSLRCTWRTELIHGVEAEHANNEEWYQSARGLYTTLNRVNGVDSPLDDMRSTVDRANDYRVDTRC